MVLCTEWVLKWYLLTEFTHVSMNENHEWKQQCWYINLSLVKKCVPLIDPLTYLVHSYLFDALMH